MSFENITLEKKDKTGWLTISRPEAMNVLSMATVLEIEKALDDIEQDENDLKELGKLDLMWNMNYSRACHRVFGKIEKMGKPFIVGINGMAMGGGFELILACPLRVMSDKAHLSFPELGLGAIPGAGGTQRLPRLIGKSRAVWYILTGERIGAETALNMGLVHKVVAPELVHGECEKLASLICQKGPLATRLALEAINSGAEIDLGNALELETALMGLASASEDAKEGIQAIMGKRPPSFKGR